MKKVFKWPKNFVNGFFHEKVVFYSLVFLLVILGLDCFFQNLPISGYGLVVLTLFLIGCTTWFTCHGIKWIINSNKPLWFYLIEKSQNEKWIELLVKFENIIFNNLFNRDHKLFDNFKYPTNLNEQIRLLIKDIERDFVKVWYSEISQNPLFLFDSHLILEEIFFKILKKLKTINCKSIVISILILYLNHLQEYKKSMKKLVRLSDELKPKMELPDLCRYSHPCSQSDHLLDYYLKKLTKSLLKEFASHDFSVTLECKILGSIIGRKVFRKLLTTVEDPNWINLKLIYLLNSEKHRKLLGNKVYTVKEKAVEKEDVREFEFKNTTMLSKKYLSSTIFDGSKNFFDRNEFYNENGAKVDREDLKNKLRGKEVLLLPLHSVKSLQEGSKGNISTVLSSLISSTAGPLLPDNISVQYKAFNKMWQSPVTEDVTDSISNSLYKVFDGKKSFLRSRSTESLAEIPGSIKAKDVSFGEELSESIRFDGSQKIKKLTKTKSFDNDSLIMEDSPVENAPRKPDKDNQGDVSPVYEEPEDFATTIAKLRSLLHQRESNSTLSDKSSLSTESTRLSLDKSETSNKSLEGESFDSQTPCDIPSDGRLFINVCIPKGELVTDCSGSPYVLYTIQYDGIYVLKDEQNSSSEPELVLQTTVVKRKFQEFLNLQAKLEENNNYKALMKGVKGPSKWLTLNSRGSIDDSTGTSRRAILETFLRELCSKAEISNSQELHEFLSYGQSGDAFVKKCSLSSPQRIDKVCVLQLLANKVTGVFNSIKTALPSFDFDSAAIIATSDTVKGFQEQKLLQNFLNFGNKTEIFELNFGFAVKEPTGESLTDDIRHYFSEKSDCIENAVDVLNSSDWISDLKECRFIFDEGKCVWDGYKDVVLEDELEPLDSWLPVYSLFLDIISELLQDSESWAIKEPVVRSAKVFSGHWEKKFQEKLHALDWDRISANVIRLLRGVVFQSEESENVDVEKLDTKNVLKEVITELMPGWINEFVKLDDVSSAVSLFVDSFQHFRLNRDVLLRLMDILLAQLFSCCHLTID